MSNTNPPPSPLPLDGSSLGKVSQLKRTRERDAAFIHFRLNHLIYFSSEWGLSSCLEAMRGDLPCGAVHLDCCHAHLHAKNNCNVRCSTQIVSELFLSSCHLALRARLSGLHLVKLTPVIQATGAPNNTFLKISVWLRVVRRGRISESIGFS